MKLKEFWGKLKKEKSIAIFIHARPDGDCIGSAFGLKHYLKLFLTQKVEVFCDDDIPEKFAFLMKDEVIHKDFFGEYSAYLSLDCASETRMGKFADIFSAFPNTYNLDHHVSNTNFAKYNCVIDNSSNSENVFNLMKSGIMVIDEAGANFLMMGIMTDTGNFKHSDVTDKTLSAASTLIKFGADITTINYNVFEKQSRERALLYGKTMSKIRYLLDGRFATITVTLKDLEESGAKSSETEGFIDFLMGIDGVEVGACLLETEKDVFKISFRSRKADVSAVAGAFGGGGHVLASGCKIKGEYEEVIDKIRYAVSQHLID